jgi:hypothetical protein
VQRADAYSAISEGDVQAAEALVGEKGTVTGMVAGKQVVVRGTGTGGICSRRNWRSRLKQWSGT